MVDVQTMNAAMDHEDRLLNGVKAVAMAVSDSRHDRAIGIMRSAAVGQRGWADQAETFLQD